MENFIFCAVYAKKKPSQDNHCFINYTWRYKKRNYQATVPGRVPVRVANNKRVFLVEQRVIKW